MSDTFISVHKLKPGDIFLCEFKSPGTTAYIEALITAIRYSNYKSKEEESKFLNAAFTILRGLIIYFDQDIYTHAAFWDGHGIVEAGPNGVQRNPIEEYKGTNTDVYRFVKDGFVLGTNQYPSEPLVELADDIVKEELNYSYTTAIMMIFLCITRWEREQWIKNMEVFLKEHIRDINPTVIDIIFKQNHDKLVEFFEWMADEMILQVAKFRKDKGLVCSETVAAIFNQAEPRGKYHIEKPLSYQVIEKPDMPILLNKDEQSDSALTKFISELSTASFPLRSEMSKDWRKHADIIYTPHDLARSVNTEIVGRLKFE